MRYFGIDIGSITLGCALVEDGKVIAAEAFSHSGEVGKKLAALFSKYQKAGFDSFGITSSMYKTDPAILDPVLCQAEGARFLAPGCRNVFSVGGERFALFFFDRHGQYLEHSENPPCASGTGSFVEQQAERLSMSLCEFASRAQSFSGEAPRIATRCAVFAKSDIIHAMQEGHSQEAIAAGLCDGIARSLVEVLVKGRALYKPVAILGGVSQNVRIVEALGKLLNTNIHVPPHAAVAGAIGAALLGNGTAKAVESICNSVPQGSIRREAIMPAQENASGEWKFLDDGDVEIFCRNDVGDSVISPHADLQAGAGLGIDIGSTSTKSAVLAPDGTLVAGFYTRTLGDPATAVARLLRSMTRHFGGKLPEFNATGTTGSGRKMIRTLFQADIAVNEITAHALAAKQLFPDVDTIIEIGGQDSKYTRLSGGEVISAQMNYVCAAGTGSFIEEQAKKLGLSLQEFSDAAIQGRAPYTSDRCTVYMERDLAVMLGEGWDKKDLAAAVLFSVRDNYLSRVVGTRGFGKHVVFQGATARNRALVAVFQEAVEAPIRVSSACHLTGAIGAGLLALERSAFNGNRSTFIPELEPESLRREVCKLCANHCTLTVITSGSGQAKTAQPDTVAAAWGMKCGRDYSSGRPAKPPAIQLEKRRKAAFDYAAGPSASPSGAAVNAVASTTVTKIILVPALYHRDYLPLWKDFFNVLGIQTEIVNSDAKAVLLGRECVNADFCAPMNLAHGLVARALEKEGLVFLPALVAEAFAQASAEAFAQASAEVEPAKLFREKTDDAYYCYYSEYLPVLAGNLTGLSAKDRLITPLLDFGKQTPRETGREVWEALSKTITGLDERTTVDAFIYSLDGFRKAQKSYRKKLALPQNGKVRVVLLGRPYSVFDQVMASGIPEELDALGAEVFWQDEIDTDGIVDEYSRDFACRMHWHYGRQILAAAEYIAQTRDTYAVFISCFRCSPDSFLLSYVQTIMERAGKPYLSLTLDELASAVGYTTRIEAAMHSFTVHGDSVKSADRYTKNSSGAGLRGSCVPSAPDSGEKSAPDALAPGDTVLIPYLNKLIGRFWAESFKAAGFKSEVLENSAEILKTGFRHSHGGECLPAVAIVGGMIEKVKREKLDPAKTALYLPTLCIACNFPQFPILARRARDEAGLAGLKIALVNSMFQGEALPGQLSIRLFEGGVLASLLYKLYFRIKPYETEPGACEAALARAEELVANAMEKNSDVRAAFTQAAELFRNIVRNESQGRKPRIGVLGDFYVKYNEVMNRNLDQLVMRLGGELVIPSFTELAFHFFDVDVRQNNDSPRHMKMLSMFEKRYERIVADLVGEYAEPEWDECVKALVEYGIQHYIPGETSLNLSRALYYIRHKSVDAILHINPMFCCPGVVSSSVFKKISQDTGVPIVDIFYDGTGDPNRVLVPHLHYLVKKTERVD